MVTGAESAVLGAACGTLGIRMSILGVGMWSLFKWKQTPQMTNCFSTDSSALRLHVRHQRSSWCTGRTGDNSDSQVHSPKWKIQMPQNQQAKERWLWCPSASPAQPERADTICRWPRVQPALHLCHLSKVSQRSHENDKIISNSQVRKLRPKDVKQLVQNHIVNMW